VSDLRIPHAQELLCYLETEIRVSRINTDHGRKAPRDELGAQERLDRGIANALRMPPKPHKDEPKKRGHEPKPAPKS
jgi:hypothetical protein